MLSLGNYLVNLVFVAVGKIWAESVLKYFDERVSFC